MSNSEKPFGEEDDINFHFEDVKFDFPDTHIIISWLKSALSSNNKKLRSLNFIFCSDNYLHEMNVKYLYHDTLTDVITFSYSDDDELEGDVFISTDRVRENATELDIPFHNELHRVMIHGVLHLLGLNDKTKADKENMTLNENKLLSILNGMKLDKN